jgi:ABC-type transporter Mla MlaB component
MTVAQLIQQGEGRYAVTGELSFATVTELLQQSRAMFSGASMIELDLSGVTHAACAIAFAGRHQ